MVAICSTLSPTLIACFFNSSTTTSTALSIPLFKSIGLVPAATILKPACAIACANTVAVVVPSPAESAVLCDTSFTNCAPIFSKVSSKWISFATDTPSLVICGIPFPFCNSTFLPLGPNVTLTAFAKISNPLFKDSLASTSNFNSFAIIYYNFINKSESLTRL